MKGLEDKLGRTLACEGLYRPEKRPFWPHVTVARVRNEGGGSRQPMQVGGPIGPVAEGAHRLVRCRPDLPLPF